METQTPPAPVRCSNCRYNDNEGDKRCPRCNAELAAPAVVTLAAPQDTAKEETAKEEAPPAGETPSETLPPTPAV